MVNSARPFAKLGWSSSANGRAESVVYPAQLTAELNPWLIQLDRSPNWTGPARRFAELNLWLIQLVRFDKPTIRPLFFFSFSTSFYFYGRKDLLRKFSDVDFVVTDFDPNRSLLRLQSDNDASRRSRENSLHH